MTEADARLFTALAALVAAASFLFSVVSKYLEARRNREIAARNAWDSYLKLAFDNPRFSRGGVKWDCADDKEQYAWFVSRMLYAAEEVLFIAEDDRAWRHVIALQVSYHKKYIAAQNGRWRDSYSRQLVPIIAHGLALDA